MVRASSQKVNQYFKSPTPGEVSYYFAVISSNLTNFDSIKIRLYFDLSHHIIL